MGSRDVCRTMWVAAPPPAQLPSSYIRDNPSPSILHSSQHCSTSFQWIVSIAPPTPASTPPAFLESFTRIRLSRQFLDGWRSRPPLRLGFGWMTRLPNTRTSLKKKEEVPVSSFYRSRFPHVTEWVFGVGRPALPQARESCSQHRSDMMSLSGSFGSRAGASHLSFNP